MRQLYLAYRPRNHGRSLSLAHVVSRPSSGHTLCGREVDDHWQIYSAYRIPVGLCAACRARTTPEGEKPDA